MAEIDFLAANHVRIVGLCGQNLIEVRSVRSRPAFEIFSLVDMKVQAGIFVNRETWKD